MSTITVPAPPAMHDNDADNTFGRWLEAMMRARGWTNAELGRRIDVDGSHISKWRRGRQRPDTVSCRLLAEALSVPVREVMIQAGHVDPEAAFEDPVKDELHRLIDQLPSGQLEPFIDVFKRMRDRAS